MIHSSLEPLNEKFRQLCQVEEKRKTSEKSIWKAISFLKRATEAGPKALPNVAGVAGNLGDRPRQACHTQPGVGRTPQPCPSVHTLYTCTLTRIQFPPVTG